MKKHAYLIMAHTQPELLMDLLRLLDDARNDLYIHIDQKSEGFAEEVLAAAVTEAAVHFTERTDVKWGSYSQIHCELVLLKEAVKTEHSYYHLLSGMDLPIKTQEEIHRFFEAYEGMEFVDEDQEKISEAALDRVRYAHPLFGRQGSLSDLLGAALVKLQKSLGIDRIKGYEPVVFQKGRNWFSITHGLATEVLKREAWIREVFGQAVCADELFLQTVARNSAFADRICNRVTHPEIPDTRLIDWARGTNNNPYIFRNADYEELMRSDGLFARKFDLTADREIVEKLCAALAVH